eukprot:GHVQ01042943.1.p1 GENE.GHVQ01042943.1~~GHVQ01042943.1.p1  ORF type:complete len:255 (+),score=22.85 GHVQ01042943.1:1280-2044(+)
MEQEMMLPGLSNKRCLITGASRGIGREIAIKYAKYKPAVLYLVGRCAETLSTVKSTCEAAGAQKVEILTVDLVNADEVQKLATDLLSPTWDSYGVDVLVNNAGINLMGSALKGELQDFETCINCNLLAPMILTRMLVPQMKERQHGTIVNIGSTAGLDGIERHGLYPATKFGLRGWSLHSYRKLRYDNIKVMLISPGFVATDMAFNTMGTDEYAARCIQPNDVAEVALLPFRTSGSCCPEEVTMRPNGDKMPFE